MPTPSCSTANHDVFGDGRVRILSAPGHTPGHQALFLDLAETGPLVLSGDLYHLRVIREHRRVPVFNVDADMTLASMDRIEAFVAEVGATFWIEHDLALFEGLNKRPPTTNSGSHRCLRADPPAYNNRGS